MQAVDYFAGANKGAENLLASLGDVEKSRRADVQERRQLEADILNNELKSQQIQAGKVALAEALKKQRVQNEIGNLPTTKAPEISVSPFDVPATVQPYGMDEPTPGQRIYSAASRKLSPMEMSAQRQEYYASRGLHDEATKEQSMTTGKIANQKTILDILESINNNSRGDVDKAMANLERIGPNIGFDPKHYPQARELFTSWKDMVRKDADGNVYVIDAKGTPHPVVKKTERDKTILKWEEESLLPGPVGDAARLFMKSHIENKQKEGEPARMDLKAQRDREHKEKLDKDEKDREEKAFIRMETGIRGDIDRDMREIGRLERAKVNKKTPKARLEVIDDDIEKLHVAIEKKYDALGKARDNIKQKYGGAVSTPKGNPAYNATVTTFKDHFKVATDAQKVQLRKRFEELTGEKAPL